MRIVLQRVNKAQVLVKNKVIGKIKRGLLVFLGVKRGDTEKDIYLIKNKLLKLRVFEKKKDKFDKSLVDINGEILVIPQFTLFAKCWGGNRPYFGDAANSLKARPLFEKFVEELKKTGLKVEKGKFGAKMTIEAINNGPVTIILDSEDKNY